MFVCDWCEVNEGTIPAKCPTCDKDHLICKSCLQNNPDIKADMKKLDEQWKWK